MHRFIRRPTALVLVGLTIAGLAFLTQISLVAAHAGEAHPHHAEATPWPIAGPIIALVVSGAAFWLANRGGSRRLPPGSHAGPTDPTGASIDGDRDRSGIHVGR
jgi:hypothetical protein